MATSSKPHQALNRYNFIPSALSCHCSKPAAVIALYLPLWLPESASLTGWQAALFARGGKSYNYQQYFLLDKSISCSADCLIILLLAVSLPSIMCCYVYSTCCIHAACCFLLLLCASYNWHCCCRCCRSPGRDVYKALLNPLQHS